MSRGQVAGVDLLFSVMIFTAVIFSAAVAWNNALTSAIQVQKDSSLESAALRVSTQLASFAGYPAEWDASNVAVLGLADEPNELNSSKLSNMAVININTTKELLGVPQFGMRVRVFKANGGGNVSEFGDTPDPSVQSIVVSDSYAALGNEIVVLRVSLWRVLL